MTRAVCGCATALMSAALPASPSPIAPASAPHLEPSPTPSWSISCCSSACPCDRHHELRNKGAAGPAPPAGAPARAPLVVSVPLPSNASGAPPGAGSKRQRDDDHEAAQQQPEQGSEAALKRQHTEDGAAADAAAGAAPSASAAPDAEPETDCKLCAKMLKMGRDKMMVAVQGLPTPATQKLGAMILGAGTPRFDQLWHRLTFPQVQSMLAKAELGVSERVELLKTVCFHVHTASEEEREKLESQKYVSQGLPPDVADFVFMCLDGKEGTATMTEYFSALEVCKTLYGTSEEQYFTVSSTMANVFMGM